jgi:CxxC motif-containing protein (DUF1111 family)
MKSRNSTGALAVVPTILGWMATVAVVNAATDPGVRPGTAAANPIPGLTVDQATLFQIGQDAFNEVEELGDGLGPRFNLDGCGGCHSFPATGGTSPAVNPQVAAATAFGARNAVPAFINTNGPIREARFKFRPNGARDGGVHSLFVISGRLDTSGSAGNCDALQEDFNAHFARGNVSLRIPTPLFGGGLMESIPDNVLATNLARNAAHKAQLGIAGHLNANGNDGRATRFGWKAQNVSLLLFAGEAYNVEMGLTSELFPTERDPNPKCQTDTVPNNITGRTGITDPDLLLSDIEKFSLFMRFLAPPAPSATVPGGAASITHGQQVFSDIGCALCHTPSLQTSTTTVAALSNQPVALFSDLAVHRMGPKLADNILQGNAGPDEFRTAPLWGLGQRIFLLHDGRTTDLVQAIQAHSSGGNSWAFGAFSEAFTGERSGLAFAPSEANRVIENYGQLGDSAQQDLLNFLRSL